MSGAMLAWGVDLGDVNSVAALLFSDRDEEGPGDGETEGWELFNYGEEDSRRALLLTRSLQVTDGSKQYGDKEFGVQGFFGVTLGSSGFPVLASQPTSEEIEDLKDIVAQVRPDAGTVELSVQPLLLPFE